MSVTNRHLRPRREKVFIGHEARLPLDREAKIRVMHLARVLSRRTEKGKHYGQLTAKFVAVLQALVWLIHDGRSGQCNPSYETIADKAGCARSTVAEAIRALEACGLLGWVQRIRRVREYVTDLFGRRVAVWRVLRTSNAYVFRDPKGVANWRDLSASRRNPSKSEFRSGPTDPVKKKPWPGLAAPSRPEYRPSEEAMRRGRAELGLPEPGRTA